MQIEVIKPSVELVTPKLWLTRFPYLIETAGRTCYKSEDNATQDSAEAFVKQLIVSGHESVLEHCCITVRFTCDRSCSHQLVRHRLGSFSQESQRYVGLDKAGFRVVCPVTIEGLDIGQYEKDSDNVWFVGDGKLSDLLEGDKLNNAEVWLNAIYGSFNGYMSLKKAGVKSEDARSLLPNAVATEVVSTFNIRQWRHVFEERALNKKAQKQIRELMLDTLVMFNVFVPCLFSDLALHVEPRHM